MPLQSFPTQPFGSRPGPPRRWLSPWRWHTRQMLPGMLREVGISHKGMGPAPVLRLILSQHREAIRRALHESLKFEGRLTSIFRVQSVAQRSSSHCMPQALSEAYSTWTVDRAGRPPR